MNELVTYETYEQFKVALDTEILSAAESFVKIGYLLKQARDTNILHNSGYANLYEFAKAEYGIDKGTVSRYIAINDRFSIGGNSPALEDKYSGRGVAKLQEMLTMSDEVIDVIPESTTKAEIQDIKRDIKAEEEKTDIEVLMEDRGLNVSAEEIELNTLTRQAMYYHLKSDKEAYSRLCKVFKESEGGEDVREQVMKALAPSGVATPRTRVPGVGTILLSIQGLDDMQFVNVRSNEKESQAWSYIQDMLFVWFGLAIRAGQSAAGRYEEFYGEEFEEVAPVQPTEKYKESVTNPEENKETVSETEETSEEKKEESGEEQEVEKVTGEVVEEKSWDLEEITEKLAHAFIKRYEGRLEHSENMRDEVFKILDKVHKSEWIFECGEEEFFAVEAAGDIKIRLGEEIIITFEWMDFYQFIHKVYWKEAENYTPPIVEENESCIGATEEQVQGQAAIADYPEYLPENVKSNMEIWQEIKAQAKTRIESIQKALGEDNYALIKWDAQKLAELMEAIQ